MKKAIVIVSLLLACVCAGAQGIGSAADLQAFIQACNKGESLLPWAGADSVVYLSADIDLAKVKKMPQVVLFKDHFDGKGHRLKNWKTTCGLFKAVDRAAVVEGIVIDKSCSLKAAGKGEDFYSGFIADWNNGTVRDCVNEAPVTYTNDYALKASYLGGLVGFNRFIVMGCRNSGSVMADVSGAPKEEVFISVGGVCGGGGNKANTQSAMIYCENEGAVKGVSNLTALYVGGITGNSGRSQLKYCVNKGAVVADLREQEDGKVTALSRGGGVVGMAKNHISHCENFGPVETTGACGGTVGGIVGIPHADLVVVDCVNYGSVKATGEQPSQVGGIVGGVGRPAHIRGCVNYGPVRFDGVSSRARSTAAGIVGSVYVPKSQTAAAYVSHCVNYGDISSASGGNKYDSNNLNAIHTAGVVGCAESRQGLRGRVMDCANYGKVTAAGGRTGDIIASAVAVETGGVAPADWAIAMKAAAPNGNVTGTVLTPSGEPWEGVVVTDGLQCVKTDKDGRYAMWSDLGRRRFIYLSIPANAQIPTYKGIPATFKRVPHHAPAVQADFVMEKKEVSKDYTVLMVADPQVRPYGWDNSMETWHERVAPDVEAFRASLQGEVYCVNLGDLVYNEMSAWDDYLDGAAIIRCPTFNVIGNHDYDQFNLFETRLGNIFYETYVGPSNYSFDLGDIHYVVMNDILTDPKTPKESKYHYGLDRETLDWLIADLANVPKDRIIVTCTHNNPFKTPNTSPHGSHNAYSINYQEYLRLLSSYKEVYAWNGHSHVNFYYNYQGKETPHGAPNIQCISVTRATGALRLNRETGPMGEPQGYMVMDVKGETLSWYYKGVGEGKDYQMRVYAPSRTDGISVKANIWNWSEGWSTPEWYEGGVKVADMIFTPGVDPDYYDLFTTVDNKTTRKYCQPATNSYIFSVRPTAGATGGEVRVRDMFGNTYTQAITWQDASGHGAQMDSAVGQVQGSEPVQDDDLEESSSESDKEQ